MTREIDPVNVASRLFTRTPRIRQLGVPGVLDRGTLPHRVVSEASPSNTQSAVIWLARFPFTRLTPWTWSLQKSASKCSCQSLDPFAERTSGERSARWHFPVEILLEDSLVFRDGPSPAGLTAIEATHRDSQLGLAHDDLT